MLPHVAAALVMVLGRCLRQFGQTASGVAGFATVPAIGLVGAGMHAVNDDLLAVAEHLNAMALLRRRCEHRRYHLAERRVGAE